MEDDLDQCGYCGATYRLTPDYREPGVCPADLGRAYNGLTSTETY